MPPLGQGQNLKSLLECPICLETFDDPRTLPCLHSFCKRCLESFVEGKHEDELNCPVCRYKFALNEGVAEMTRNHFICNMLEALTIQHQEKCIPCSYCEQPSVGRCVTCELFMCEKCLESHNGYIGFRDHVVLTMEELSKPEHRSKIKGKSFCKKHTSKKLKLYCETCEELICTYCVVFEHVRPDHECSPLEEIAERKREELKKVCEVFNINDSQNTEFYYELAFTAIYLDENLKQAKSQIQKSKNSVLKFVNALLEKKAQCLIKELENSAKVKHQTIDEELKRVSDHMAGQRKTYDVAKALVENGSNEEIMLSYKSVRQSVENSEMKYERKEIDDKLPQCGDDELDSKFFHEINTSGRKWTSSSDVGRRLVFDPLTGRLRSLQNNLNPDEVVAVAMAKTGFVCGPVHK